MSNNILNLDSCGCCEGIRPSTPESVKNDPGLAALVYRVGTHGTFKASMKALLSTKEPLEELTTREDDDPAIALVDAWATVLDVLTFYQERIANEGYLRTAQQRRSVLELARHISYTLRPGVAASTYLAFTIDESKGAPTEAIIHEGTKVQSIPGQDEAPQVFETVEEIEARREWNAIKPQLSEKFIPGFRDKEVYLKGILTGLKPGDGILMIGAERRADTGSERWDFRRIKEVITDKDRDYTKLTWDEGLGWQIFRRIVLPAEKDFQVFAFREQAFLFGHNAPDWRVISDSVREEFLPNNKTLDDFDDWPGFDIGSISGIPEGEEIDTIYLDGHHPKIVKGGWLVLAKYEPRPEKEPLVYHEVYEVTDTCESSLSNFTLTSKTTAVSLKGENLREEFNDNVRETVVFSQSEELEITKRPVTHPVQGHQIALDELMPDLPENRPVIISGKRCRVQVSELATNLVLKSTENSESVSLAPGDSLMVMQPPKNLSGGRIEWTLKDKLGFIGTLKARVRDVSLIPSEEDDETVSEIGFIESIERDTDPTVMSLEDELANCYDRCTVTIYGNVAAATHGETKSEILGSGDGSLAFQEFQLKQKPMTFVSAASASGTQTTLEIRVNDVLWKEVPTFYGVSSEERVYITRIADDGTVRVRFGDGITGARLPTGTENVKATYRIGTGLDGLLDAEQLTLLMTPQLGVKGVINPLKPTGADDPETRDKARRNAPLTVLTLDRIVALKDYEDFARAFAGIGKARADLLWKGEQRVVHITVAAADGTAVEMNSDLYRNLATAVDSARHTNYQVQVASFQPLTFDLKARVMIDSEYIAENVISAVSEALLEAFSFEARDFGQAVTPSEVTAIMQAIDGVIAVDLELLDGQDPFSVEHFRLKSETARWAGDTIAPAEILTVNPSGIEILEMSS